MSDPLSATVNVIAVAALAYASCKALHQTVKRIQDAPKTFLDLSTDLETLRGVLGTLGTKLNSEDNHHALPETLTSYIKDLELPLKACSDACNQFKLKLDKVMSNSTDEHASFRDRVRLHFREKEVTAFRYRLASYKSTLTIALEFTSL